MLLHECIKLYEILQVDCRLGNVPVVELKWSMNHGNFQYQLAGKKSPTIRGGDTANQDYDCDEANGEAGPTHEASVQYFISVMGTLCSKDVRCPCVCEFLCVLCQNGLLNGGRLVFPSSVRFNRVLFYSLS